MDPDDRRVDHKIPTDAAGPQASLPNALYSNNLHGNDRRVDHKIPLDASGPLAPSLPNALYSNNVHGIDSRRTFGSDWAIREKVAHSKPSSVVQDKSDSDVQIIRFSDPATISDHQHHGDGQKSRKSVHDGYDSDVISGYIGHYGRWQFFWTFLLCLFQIPCTFEIFVFVFQVSLGGNLQPFVSI